MKNKILAIGIPSYNAELYLDRGIPTFIHEKLMDRIEVIIVNDGSKDKTQEIAEKYAALYPDTVKVINKENGGHGSAVNAALYSTKAKYYKVVDADDWVETKALIKLVDFLEKNDVDIVSTAYNHVDMVSGCSVPINNYNVKYGKILKLSEIDLKEIYLSIHSTTYKTKLLQDNNIRLQENTFYVDVEYQLLPFEFVETIAFLDESVYRYMVGNVNQSVNIDNFVSKYDNHDRVVRRILEFLKTAKLNKYQKEYIENVFEKVMYTHYALSCIYDTDTERGRERSLVFDKHLKETNPRLYKFMGKKYSNIKKFRAKKFAAPKKRLVKLKLLRYILSKK